MRKNKKERYTVGAKNAPKWYIQRIMPYMKDDGSTGYAFYGERRCFEVSVGDVLVWDGFRVNIIRKKVAGFECKRVP